MNPYDADVVVIGGGPAGLAAAIRVRWVKGYRAFPSSVQIVECGRLGGLLRFGGAVLTGPGLAYAGEELFGRLRRDVEKLHIPVVCARATAVHPDAPCLRVELEDGRSLRCLAVVVATGFRPLANELDYFGRGLFVTYKGTAYLPDLIRDAASAAEGRGLAVGGNDRTVWIRPVLDAVASDAGGIRFIAAEHFEALTGTGRVEGVRLRSGRVVSCGACLLDYHAIELQPHLAIRGLEANLDERGFIRVDRWMGTAIEGVFAAGDVTGRYASTVMALGDGVAAGFSAYRWAFRHKFGCEPALFAYRADDRPLGARPDDLPELPADAVAMPLGPCPDWVDGMRTLGEIVRDTTKTLSAVRRALIGLALDRRVTVHCLAGHLSKSLDSADRETDVPRGP